MSQGFGISFNFGSENPSAMLGVGEVFDDSSYPFGSMRTPKSRRIRHRDFRGLRKFPRRLDNWLEKNIAEMYGTASNNEFTSSGVSGLLTVVGHGYKTGDGPFHLASSGVLPSPFARGTLYWVGSESVDTLGVYASYQDSIAGRNRIDAEDAGDGQHAIYVSMTKESLVEMMRRGKLAETIESSTDIDDLVG